MTDQKRTEDEDEGHSAPDTVPRDSVTPDPETDAPDAVPDDVSDYATVPDFPHVEAAEQDEPAPQETADAAQATESPEEADPAPWDDSWTAVPEEAAPSEGSDAVASDAPAIPDDNTIPEVFVEPDAAPGAMALAAASAAAAGATAASGSTGPAAAAQQPREVVRETVVRKGGFFPGLVGGLIGGLAVALLAPRVLPPDWLPAPDTSAVEARVDSLSAAVQGTAAELSQLSGTVTELGQTAAAKADLDALGERATGLTSDLEGVTSAVADISTEAQALTGRVDALSGQIGQLLPRIDELDRRPIAESPDPTAVSAVQSYGREVAALRTEFADQVSALREDVAAMTAKANETLEESVLQASQAREQAAAEAAAAAQQALVASRQQALIEIQSALEAGTPYDTVLQGLDGVEVPEGLSAPAADGVDTLATLQADFPPLAREALAVARQDLSGDTATGRGVSFLQRQLGVRSLAPRDGDGPDAVLSRAEAAVREARLSDAVSELQNLPDPAKAVMQGWMTRASARVDALTAANDLAAGLTPN